MHFPLTSQQLPLSKRFLVYKFLSYLFFTHAIWFHFYRLSINDQQIGLVDSIAFTIGLCAEVPSGALADLYGRGRIVKFGQILAAVGFIIQGFGDSFLVTVHPYDSQSPPTTPQGWRTKSVGGRKLTI